MCATVEGQCLEYLVYITLIRGQILELPLNNSVSDVVLRLLIKNYLNNHTIMITYLSRKSLNMNQLFGGLYVTIVT